MTEYPFKSYDLKCEEVNRMYNNLFETLDTV